LLSVCLLKTNGCGLC